jgi:chromosome segregation ATPase
MDFVERSEYDAMKARAEAAEDKLAELLSYMPKVPTEPYEQTLAKQINELTDHANELQTELEHAKKQLEQLKQEMIGYIEGAACEAHAGDEARVKIIELEETIKTLKEKK